MNPLTRVVDKNSYKIGDTVEIGFSSRETFKGVVTAVQMLNSKRDKIIIERK